MHENHLIDWESRPVARLFFCVCVGRGGGAVKLVKFWDLLSLRVDYLAIALDLVIWGGGGQSDPPDCPPSYRPRKVER